MSIKNNNGKIKSPQKSKKILSDHRPIGKKLIPPMMQLPGISTAIHYDRDVLPELLWLALVEEKFGLKVAASVAEHIGRFVENAKLDKRLITISDMYGLEDSTWQELKAYLKTMGSFDRLATAIHDLVVLYPDCPLKSIFESTPVSLISENFMSELEKLFEKLLHKRGRRAVLMQANALYLLGCQGRLFINEGLSLGNFEELKNYPETEESKKVGASVCAASGMLISLQKGEEQPKVRWADYFWRRNLQLLPINFNHLKEKYDG